ncbi:MAG: hypothetical protein GEU90_02355 [Gemmatimonas sp.]|nr:hypothetical protein [Gemmatimonas sp.]
MIRSLTIAILVLTGTSAHLQGQQHSRDADDPGPITTLVKLQVEVGLTAAQVEELTSIDLALEQQNQPLVTRLMEIRRKIRALGPRRQMSSEDHAVFESYIAEARPLMREIDQNNKGAMAQVGEVLTEAQKDRLARLLRDRNENSERSDRDSRSRDRRH